MLSQIRDRLCAIRPQSSHKEASSIDNYKIVMGIKHSIGNIVNNIILVMPQFYWLLCGNRDATEEPVK